MPGRREQVLAAVEALVQTALPAAKVERNPSNITQISANGFVAVGDGDPGEPEVTLSPTTYIYAHRIPVEIAVNKPRTGTAEAAIDDRLTAIGAAIQADRSLGGLVDWLEAEAPTTDELDAPGAGTARWANVVLVATYGTTNPLT